MEKVRQVSWGSAVFGGLAGLALTFLFLWVSTPMIQWLSGFGSMVMFGVTILVVGLLRAVAGMWTSQLVRRRYDVRRRREFLPTAVAAALIGWLLYTVLILVSASQLGIQEDVPRLLLDVLQWVAEFCLGAYIVSPERQPAKEPSTARR